MTDYEGLGTYGTHPYLLGVSEGRGVLDIVPAVRRLAAQIGLPAEAVSDRYAVVGHSQGEVKAADTATLVEQFDARNGAGSELPELYENGVATPDPETLGEHVGLLVDDREIQALLGWFAGL